MQQMFSPLLVRACALHFATSVVVLSDIELADQGGSGRGGVLSWIIPSTEVTHTLRKGAGVKILKTAFKNSQNWI